MKQNEHIFIKNIYYMLSYAFQVLRQQNYEDIATEQFDNIHNLFAAILGKGISQQLKQGLYREYLSHTEDIPLVRGKIDMAGTIRNQIARRRVLTCEYDELSENNLLNQILKATVSLLLQSHDVDKERKDILKKEMAFFSDIRNINPVTVAWQGIRFHRNNQTYRMLVSLCQLIIEGMLLSSEKGLNRLMSFVDEQRMCRLYEKFLLAYYAKEFPQLQVSASQIPWALDDDTRTMLPIMQTDVTLTHKDKVLIIDAKYYGHIVTQGPYGGSLHSQNLYQIFTYVKNKEQNLKDKLHEVSGMLLYAQTDERDLPDCTYSMSGNKIAVKTLNLNCDFTVIREQLDKIASDFLGV
ncbi:MAG: 5-methylcytosine-specific restriction endonuclease system specificity protein McrC [Prevotellaceae bacterium]|nr:5-methylcytosine-specific restriction endonuclease system specificity protein McrC [Prevotellaceae bacterium]